VRAAPLVWCGPAASRAFAFKISTLLLLAGVSRGLITSSGPTTSTVTGAIRSMACAQPSCGGPFSSLWLNQRWYRRFLDYGEMLHLVRHLRRGRAQVRSARPPPASSIGQSVLLTHACWTVGVCGGD
jgi:hypothetical protein